MLRMVFASIRLPTMIQFNAAITFGKKWGCRRGSRASNTTTIPAIDLMGIPRRTARGRITALRRHNRQAPARKRCNGRATWRCRTVRHRMPRASRNSISGAMMVRRGMAMKPGDMSIAVMAFPFGSRSRRPPIVMVRRSSTGIAFAMVTRPAGRRKSRILFETFPTSGQSIHLIASWRVIHSFGQRAKRTATLSVTKTFPLSLLAAAVMACRIQQPNFFLSRHIIILADNDDAGRVHAEKKAALAHSAGAASVRVVHFLELPEHHDVTDFFQAGGTVEELTQRAEAAPIWCPSQASTTSEAADAWDDPDWSLLDERRGTLPEFLIKAFDKPWQEWVELAAHGAGVTPGHVAVPLIAIASSLIGAARRVQPSRSWTEPMTLWAAVVGFSGTGKTPGIDVTKRALAHIARMRKDKLAELQRQHETRAEAAKAVYKKWKKDVEEAIAAGMPAPPRPADGVNISEFVAPRLYISDATIERIAALLQAQPRGMLVICDELAGLFLNMGRYSNGSDREFWLEAWNGKHFVVERMGRPAITLDNLLVGITGGLQPDKLARSFEGDADGMYARVCFAWPQEPSYKPLTNDVAEIEPEIINALCRLIDLEAGNADEFAPRNVPLSPEALTTFEQFRQLLHAHKGALDGREREWWAKGPSHVLRLSGTLAYLAWSIVGGPEPERVDHKSMEAAVDLWREFFWPHSRAALRQIGLSERHTNARRVLRWLKGHAKKEIGVKEVRREALSQSLDANQTRQLLDGLAQSGWLRKHTGRTGGRPVHRWAVNPALFGGAESAGSAESPPAEASLGVMDDLSALPHFLHADGHNIAGEL